MPIVLFMGKTNILFRCLCLQAKLHKKDKNQMHIFIWLSDPDLVNNLADPEGSSMYLSKTLAPTKHISTQYPDKESNHSQWHLSLNEMT